MLKDKVQNAIFEETRMKRFAVCALALSIVVLGLVGCESDWTSGGESGFNTSRGAGVNINFGGVYDGMFSGSKAVQSKSGSPVTRFVITHAGNSIRVIDNNGSQYEGNIGSPGAVAEPQGGVYPAGAELVQSQVTFSGIDYSSGKKVEFVGIFRAVAVEDIRGASSKTEDTYNRAITWTTNVTISTQTTNSTKVTTIIAYDSNGNEVYRSTETITTNPQGTVIGYDYKVEDKRNVTSVEEFKYYLTEANTQYRLEGTWMEENGVISQVDAMSKGSATTITTTQTTTSTGTGGTTGGT